MKYIIFIFCVTCYMLHVTSVSATNMKSSIYQIQFDNINMEIKNSGSNFYKINSTLDQTTPFIFSISKNYLNLGTLIPNNLSLDSAVLRITSEASDSYQVTVIEEGKLKTIDNESNIDDTSCNDNNSCDEKVANVWNSTTAYGFGYKMSGANISDTFIRPGCNNNCYRRFPDGLNLPTPEAPVIIMSNNNPTNIVNESTITIQANLPPNQKNATYQTIINFIATPGY